jgi:replicative DNA helicase
MFEEQNTYSNDDLSSSRRQLPAAVDVEIAVLGAMILSPEAVPKVLESVTPEVFFDKRNATIYSAMISLFESNEPIDTVSLFEELKKNSKLDSAGGSAYISKLAQDVSSAANVEYHSKIIVEKWILRKLISSSMDIATQAYSGTEDVFSILDAAESTIFKITEAGLKESYKGMDRAVKEAIEHIEAIHSKQLASFSVPTGFYALDDVLGGFQKSDLVIVAARPSMGKTAFALSAARNAAIDHKVPIAIFSLEMATIQLVVRLICAEAKINAHNVRTGNFKAEDGSKISRTAHRLSEAPIYIDDTPGQNVLEIRAKARRLKAEKNIGLIIIDYLQLMTASTKTNSREQEISTISRSLKTLAKELNVPVIALSQLNRAVETRTDKRPQLSDLRESGSIEQDADVVIFLTRPEYYGITQFADGESTEGIAEIIVAKQRNGPTGDVKLKFIKNYARFENLDMFHSTFETGQEQPQSPDDEDLPI